MVGISEVIQTLGAMIIFSLILLTSNRMIQMNTLQEVESEAEGLAVSLAQNIIEEAQNLPFDAPTTGNNIPSQVPQGFETCGPGACGNDRSCYNDFDDYHGYTELVDTEIGEDSFQIDVQVLYVEPSENFNIDDGSTSDRSMYKKMVVTITSEYLNNNNREIELSHLRRYYKTKN